MMTSSAMIPIMMNAGNSLMNGIGYNNQAQGYSDAYNQQAQQLQKAQDMINQYLGTATGYMQPFYDAGIKGLSAFQQGLNPLANPVQLMNSLMGQYTTSPYAQAQMNQEITAANAAGAASGMLGSGAEQKALEQSAQTITSKDMQDWLGNIFGIYKGYMGGQKTLMNQGYGAAGQMGNWNMQAGQDISSLMSSQAQAMANAQKMQSQGQSGLIGGVTGAVDDVVGGVF